MAGQRKIPLNSLRAFEAVARHCHVRRAAQELSLTHAALSRQVKILEENLGTLLFDRSGNRLALNAAGKRYLQVVQGALNSLDEGALYLNPDSMAGEVVVATTPSLSLGWLIGIVGEFSKQYPEISIRVIGIEPHQKKLPADFDIALCLGEPDVGSRQLTELYLESYFPVCSPSLLEAERPVGTAKDLLQYPLLHESLNHWQAWFTLMNMDDHEYEYSGSANVYCEYGFQAIELARRGYGVALADPVEIANDLREGKLIRLLGEGLPIDESIYLVTDIVEQQSVRARLFVELLYKKLGELGVGNNQ